MTVFLIFAAALCVAVATHNVGWALADRYLKRRAAEREAIAKADQLPDWMQH